MTDQNLIPVLRFSEFNEVFELKTMREFTSINQGLQIAISNRLSEQVEGAYFYITNEFLKEGASKKYYILNPPSNVLCSKDDVLMTRTGNTGQVVTNTEGAFHNNFFKIQYDTDIVDKDYLVYFLRLRDTQNQILRYAGTSTIPDLNHSDFYRLQIPLPCLNEQQKTASFLKSVDKRISLLEEKKARLDRYKKGIIQKIFRQEIRFKDSNGNDFSDWDNKPFGELYDFISTNSYSRDKLNYDSGDVKNIHYGDIHTEFASHFDIINEKTPFINSEVDLSRINERAYIEEGDLVIADASEDYADIGKTIEIVNINEEKVVAGLHTFLAKRKTDELTVGFGGYMMQDYSMRLNIMRIAQGTKVLGIATSRLAKLPVKFPQKEEQEKIYSFISLIDDSIKKVAEQIAHTTNFKKGLLQKMFV